MDSAILDCVMVTTGFNQLASTDLQVDAVYEGGRAGNAGDDPLGKLLPVGNQGGFRFAGSVRDDDLRLVVLYTSGSDPDWPDALDVETGLFTYFGDNRSPGKELHDTSRGGNAILRRCFDRLHAGPTRDTIPPFLIFNKASPAGGRDVRFLGIAAPGAENVARRRSRRDMEDIGGSTVPELQSHVHDSRYRDRLAGVAGRSADG